MIVNLWESTRNSALISNAYNTIVPKVVEITNEVARKKISETGAAWGLDGLVLGLVVGSTVAYFNGRSMVRADKSAGLVAGIMGIIIIGFSGAAGSALGTVGGTIKAIAMH